MTATEKRFDEYVLLEKLAAGAGGELWRARRDAGDGADGSPSGRVRGASSRKADEDDDDEQADGPLDYAVWVQTGDPAVARKCAAAWRAHRIDHPRVLPVVLLRPDHDPPFAVFEGLEGRSLREVLDEEGRLPAEQSVRLATKLLGALEAVHDGGLVHGGLSPSTVLVTDDWSIRIVGLGLFEGPPAGGSGPMARNVAPERRPDPPGKPDARTDVWGVGMLAYEMVAGDLRRVRFPIQGAPDWLSSTVETATRDRPEDRYDSVADMHAQLDGRMPASGRRANRVRRRRRRETPYRQVLVMAGWGLGGLALVWAAVVLGPVLMKPAVPKVADPKPGKGGGEVRREDLYEGRSLAEWSGEIVDAVTEEKVAKAAEALGAFGPRAVPALVRGLARHDANPAITKALADVGPAGLPLLKDLQDDRDIKVRRQVEVARAIMEGARPRGG